LSSLTDQRGAEALAGRRYPGPEAEIVGHEVSYAAPEKEIWDRTPPGLIPAAPVSRALRWLLEDGRTQNPLNGYQGPALHREAERDTTESYTVSI
jgi:hypothetical protein